MLFAIRLFILLFCLALISCSYIATPSFIKNKDNQYLTAKTIPPLKTPPGVSSNVFQNNYPIPDQHYPEAVEEVSLLPPGLEEK